MKIITRNILLIWIRDNLKLDFLLLKAGVPLVAWFGKYKFYFYIWVNATHYHKSSIQ